MSVEYLEILLPEINKKYIDLIIRHTLKITNDSVVSSHFYDKLKMRDMEYSEVSSLVDYFSTPNTGNIFTKELTIGETLTDVMIVMSFDDDFGDITLNFSESELISDDVDTLKSKVIKIVNRLIEIQREYDITSIRLGYESIIDNDNVLLSIVNGKATILNNFKGQLSHATKLAYQ